MHAQTFDSAEAAMDTTTKTIIAVGIFGLMIVAFAMP